MRSKTGMKWIKGITGFAVLTAIGASTANATLIAWDPFKTGDDRGAGEYTAGSDMRTMGAAALGWAGTPDGFGVAHAGSTSNFRADAGSNDGPGVSYEQDGRMKWLGTGNFPFNRNLTRQLKSYAGAASLYTSIILNRTTWAAADPSFNTPVIGGFVDGAGAGVQAGYHGLTNDPDLILRVGGVDNVILANSVANTNYHVIARIDIDLGGNETVTYWVNPTDVSTEAQATATAQATGVISGIDFASSLSPFTQSKYESPGQSGVALYDEIRLADSFADINVPEPASAALLGLGAMAMIRRKR